MKKTNYFSHDSNARNDDKILAVRMEFGAEGYGIYFMLLERLREDSKYMSIRDYNMIAFDFRTSVDKIKSIVEDFGLFIFTEDGNYFYSENFNERMSIKDEKTEKRSIAGRKGMASRYAKKQQNDNNVITKLDNLDNNVITDEEKNLTSKVKERKEKKRKENNTFTNVNILENKFEKNDKMETNLNNSSGENKKEKVASKRKTFVSPTIDEIVDYCNERKNNINATTFWNFYESKGWLVGKTKMKDWKAAIRTWESKEKTNKSQSFSTSNCIRERRASELLGGQN
ncbi:MAG TPA: DUF4373 domain-containing protein [Sedimentibacter sp.]|nr:DUF4373 domain-containing protein [Sedimentibacter sp.]